MENLLDNEQVEEIENISEIAIETLETICRNHPPYKGIIADAACRAAPEFFLYFGKELAKIEPSLSYFVFDTAKQIRDVVEREEEVQLCLPNV